MRKKSSAHQNIQTTPHKKSNKKPNTENDKKVRNSGVFITFEGTEGAGKSTLIREVSALLVARGYSTTQTREPGGSQLAEKIRDLILHTSMNPLTELLLYEAARAEHLSHTILPGLSHGQIVMCDRFTDSSLAYQAYARGLPWKEVTLLNEIATSGLKPDLTVFLNLDPQVGLARAKNPNRFEAEGLEFQKEVRKGYLKARKESPLRWLTLRVQGKTPHELAEKVVKEVLKRFKERLEPVLKEI